MSTEWSTLEALPDRVRISRGFRITVLTNPVELLDEQQVEGGWAFLVRSSVEAARCVVADDDEASLAVARALTRTLLADDELEQLHQRLEVAAKPIATDWERQAGAQITREKPTSWLDRATRWRRP